MADIFADNIFRWMFLNDNFWVSSKISLKYVPYGLIDKWPSLVQIMVCRRIGDIIYLNQWWLMFADAYMRHSASMS